MGKKREVITLEERSIIVKIPVGTKKMEITCVIKDENKTEHTVTKKLTKKEIKKCCDDFDFYVGDEDYDAKYVITEEGLEYLKNITNQK